MQIEYMKRESFHSGSIFQIILSKARIWIKIRGPVIGI